MNGMLRMPGIPASVFPPGPAQAGQHGDSPSQPEDRIELARFEQGMSFWSPALQRRMGSGRCRPAGGWSASREHDASVSLICGAPIMNPRRTLGVVVKRR